jgi:hypothetical protein
MFRLVRLFCARLLLERDNCSRGDCCKTVSMGAVDHGLRNTVEHGVTLLQGLHSHSQWQGHWGVCATLSWTIRNSVAREDPQAVIKDLFEGETWVVLKIDERLTSCPRFQPDGTEQDTGYVQTFLYEIGDGLCCTAQKNDRQRNAGLHSCSLVCWTTKKIYLLPAVTASSLRPRGYVKRSVASGKHLCNSDQFKEFSYHTVSPRWPPRPSHFFLPLTLARSARHSHEYPLSFPSLQLLHSCSALSLHLKADSYNESQI